jgi:hypothetical protein
MCSGITAFLAIVSSFVFTFAYFPQALSATSKTISSLTAVAVSSAERVYVGAKLQPKSFELLSSLVEVNAKTLRIRTIQLPKSLRSREILAIIPLKDRFYLLTQWAIEQGDYPILHRYDQLTGSWQQIGSIECSTFDLIQLNHDQLTVSCKTETKDGTIQRMNKRLALGSFGTTDVLEIQIPQLKDSRKKTSAALIGAPYHWDKLQIVSKGRKHTLSSQKILGFVK